MHKKGFSLIELIISIGVVLILSVGIFFLINKINIENKVRNDINNTFLIMTEIDKFTQIFGWNIPSNFNDLLVSTNSVPENMINQNNQLVNSFGGEIKIEKGRFGYKVLYNNLPPDACVLFSYKFSQYNNVEAINIINKSGAMSSFEKHKERWEYDLISASQTCNYKKSFNSKAINQIWVEFSVSD